MFNLFKRLGCLVGRHSPSRRTVRYVGHLKVGTCKHCSGDVEKRSDGRWLRRQEIRISEQD